MINWVLFFLFSFLIFSVIFVMENRKAGKEGLKITMFMFPGREKPVYELNDFHTIAHLRHLLEELRAGGCACSEFRGLHSRRLFKGIVVDNPGKLVGFPSRLVIRRDLVEEWRENCSCGCQSVVFRDSARVLHDFFLAKAYNREVIPFSLYYQGLELKKGKFFSHGAIVG